MRNTSQTNSGADARASERQRINAIMSHAEAAERPTLARFLALETNHNAEMCIGILAAAGKDEAKPAANGTPFAALMNASAQPDVGAGVGFHDDVIGSLVNLGVVDGSTAGGGSDETVALARRLGLKGFAPKG